MTPPLTSTTGWAPIPVDIDAAARDAYEMFVAHNTHSRPWPDLAEVTRESWRRVARGVLAHAGARS